MTTTLIPQPATLGVYDEIPAGHEHAYRVARDSNNVVNTVRRSLNLRDGFTPDDVADLDAPAVLPPASYEPNPIAARRIRVRPGHVVF